MQWRMKSLVALAAALCFLQAPLPAAAAPFAEHFSFTQPDGTALTFWGEGDEFHAVFETTEGYAIVFDRERREYFYAERSADGKSLRSTGVPAHRAAPKGLGKRIRIDREAAVAAARVRQRKWDEGTKLSSRWSGLKARRRDVADDPAGAPPSTTTVGTKVGLTLLVDFSDAPATVAKSEIENFLNGDSYTGNGNNGSVKKYFSDVSASRLTYTNVATVYVRLTRPKSYYNDTDKDCGAQGRLLIGDALAILKARSDYASTILPTFAPLSTDGSGNVLALNVLFAGANSGVWSLGLWPHSWGLANPIPLGDGKSVANYQITNIGTSLTLGTFCHENGHMLCGFPDIYDYDYDSIGGAGVFCLMNHGGQGTNPSQVSAYLKLAAGWVTASDLPANGTGTLVAAPAAGHDRIYRHRRSGVSTEYFLLENRQRTGRDANLPASGIAVWHIDELGDRDNQSLAANTTHSNYEVTLVQADNRWDLQLNVNSGDSRDLYYLGNGASAYTNRFSDSTSPSARWWSGAASGVNLSSFSAPGSTMTFTSGAGALPTVSVSATDATATENPLTTGAFTVSRTGSTAATLVVAYAVGGTATAGSDYAALGTSLTIPAGAAGATVTVTPIDDAAVEAPETVTLTLVAGAAYSVGSPGSATVTITSDDASLPTVSVRATGTTATENPLTTGAFTVSRTGSTAATLVVAYAVGGTATAGSDYAALGTSLTIPAGAAGATVTVTPIDDVAAEPAETVTLTLVAGAAYSVGSPAGATVTIVDDDATGYALWTRTDTGQAALWEVNPGTGALVGSRYVHLAGGVGGPWEATGYDHVDATTGYVLWTRSDTGQAVLWRVNPATGALAGAVYVYSPLGVGGPWQATSYDHVDATTGYVLWTRSDTGQAALWRVDPADGSVTSAVYLHSPLGVGGPWQATGYAHVDATRGHVLWTRGDTGQAVLWQVNPTDGTVTRAVYLLSSTGVGGPWQAAGYGYGDATTGYVLWTRSDTGQAVLWQVNPADGTVTRAVYLLSSTGVGGPWKATGFRLATAAADARPDAATGRK